MDCKCTIKYKAKAPANCGSYCLLYIVLIGLLHSILPFYALIYVHKLIIVKLM